MAHFNLCEYERKVSWIFVNGTLSIRNLLTVKCIIKCMPCWILTNVYTCVAMTQIKIKNISIIPKNSLVPSHPPHCEVSQVLFLLPEINVCSSCSCKWNHIVHILLWLATFVLHNVFGTYPFLVFFHSFFVE